MASPQGLDKWLTGNKLEVWDHDPGATTAKIVSPDGGTTPRVFDMKDYSGFVVAVMATIATTGPTLVELCASTAADGTGDVTVIKTSGTIAADAVGDWVVLECSAEEVAQEAADAGAALRYVFGRVTCGNAGDEAVAVYIGICPRYSYDGLTPATTIA